MFNPFEASGLQLVGYVSCIDVNNGDPLPLFEPVAPKGRPNINTLEGWNKLAMEGNRKAFVIKFNREPKCDAELEAWIKSGFKSDFCFNQVNRNTEFAVT